MSDPRDPENAAPADEKLNPENPGEKAREQLSENDKHLREGDEDTPEETVPET